ncbi:MAG: hypothetical protein Q9P01_02315 [Anaerolineae bacterium]|nr:hypothetical protein [Anaerolineae bacterium]
MHQRGYTLRKNRPFVKNAPKGRRTHATNTLSDAFHNWFYAGWVVSEKANIPPKAIRGQWKPVVSTEEYERGVEILQRRSSKRHPKRKHFYLLKKIIHVQIGEKVQRLSGSTPNVSRNTGGNRYCCLPRSDVNISCALVDEQIPACLKAIHVQAEHVDLLRQVYLEELDDFHVPPDELQRLQRQLEKIKQEETRSLRLYAVGKVSEDVWAEMWNEWQGRSSAIHQQIALLEQTKDVMISNLDEALQIFAQLSQLYATLSPDEQQLMLSLLIEKVIVDSRGTILRVQLHPPFAYLTSKYDVLKKRLTSKLNQSATHNVGGASEENCSEYIQLGESNGHQD